MEKSDKRNLKEKKAYITWEDNDMNSSSDLENEIINLGLMAKDYESEEERLLQTHGERGIKVYSYFSQR